MAQIPTSRDNPDTRRTVLVTGATGNQGGAAARHLRQRGFPVRAATRDPDKPKARQLAGEGMEVMRADYDDPQSLARALDGVHGVFSVQQPADAGVEGEIRQGNAIADAARRAQVGHFVYASVVASDEHTGIPFFESKFEVEQHIRNLGIAWTFLRPSFFMENWLGSAESLLSGRLSLPLTPDCGMQLIATDDIGAIAAAAFEHPSRWQGRAAGLAADEVTMSEMAAVFGRALGREVRYEQVPWEEFERKQGPAFARMYRWVQQGGSPVDIPALRREFPNMTRFEAWVQRQDWRRAGGITARA